MAELGNIKIEIEGVSELKWKLKIIRIMSKILNIKLKVRAIK